jgi:hypothetical protein
MKIGELIHQEQILSNKQEIDLSHVSQGVYIIKYHHNGTDKTTQLIKN